MEADFRLPYAAQTKTHPTWRNHLGSQHLDDLSYLSQ